jgi:hypothetical protein
MRGATSVKRRIALRFFFGEQIFSEICKITTKCHCLRNFHRATAGKQAIFACRQFYTEETHEQAYQNGASHS